MTFTSYFIVGVLFGFALGVGIGSWVTYRRHFKQQVWQQIELARAKEKIRSRLRGNTAHLIVTDDIHSSREKQETK